MQNMTQYETQARTFPRMVFFTGSTALVKGQGLCYSRSVGTAADKDGRRDKHVAVPTTSNNRAFAGVTARDYAAKSGGQWVEIYEPGSVCEIAIAADTTVNATILTCGITGDPGRFSLAGFMGRGTALALSTNASGALSSSLDGTAATSADGLTITKTGAFADAAAGDFVLVFGGQHATNGTKSTTPGKYTISSVTSDNEAVLTAACASAANDINIIVFSGNPTCLAYLFDGEESGLFEWVTPDDNVAAQSMVGGYTFIGGGVAIDTGDSTATLADGTRIGERKGFHLKGALTTNDWLLTVTSGEQLDGSTDLASLEFDGANDQSILEWGGTKWRLMHNAGTGVA